jgi:hypothetical protein
LVLDVDPPFLAMVEVRLNPAPGPLSALTSYFPYLRILYTIMSIILVLYTAFRAFHDPSRSSPLPLGGVAGGIRRFYLPVVGDLADRWVGEE